MQKTDNDDRSRGGAALTGELTARESIALVGVWSAAKAPQTRAAAIATRTTGFNGAPALSPRAGA